MEVMFTKKQIEQMVSKGIDPETVKIQIDNFKKGFPYLKVIKPAKLNDGIIVLDDRATNRYIQKYDKECKNHHIVKFVPASGAATRMFKDLYQFLTKVDQGVSDIEVEVEKIKTFFQNIKSFAFYNDLRNIVRNDERDLDKMVLNRQYTLILKYLLYDIGLNYGNLPKGLLKFHAYDGFSRTPVEEHYVEAAEYALQGNNRINLHFTVSPEHVLLFQKQFEESEYHLEEKYKVKFDVSQSIQKPSTDILAVDMENNPLSNQDGTLMFRPGGHGALLENLNDLDAEIVFIKNIDNVVPDHLKLETIKYKKVLAGILLDTKEQIFSFLFKLMENKIDEVTVKEISSFVKEQLFYILPDNFDKLSMELKKEALLKILNRPIRVCGMVKNEGEPGGGPFWVKANDNSVSLQIAESNQIDLNNPEQKKIMENSTHFNPVDIVCYIKDFQGKPFNLLSFRDPETGFISKKTKDGIDLKAQELPGLWNGSMAHWSTIFVEVPLITFNPVKTVNDLIRPQHQQEKTE